MPLVDVICIKIKQCKDLVQRTAFINHRCQRNIEVFPGVLSFCSDFFLTQAIKSLIIALVLKIFQAFADLFMNIPSDVWGGGGGQALGTDIFAWVCDQSPPRCDLTIHRPGYG